MKVTVGRLTPLGTLVLLFLLSAGVYALVGYLLQVGEAHALSNPLTTGLNLPYQGKRLRANATPRRVAAAGQNCSVTLYNNSTVPVYTGYALALGDGGMQTDGGLTTSNGMPICTTSPPCVSFWVTRDAVPQSIWYRTDSPVPAPGDGGVDIRIEMGSGCGAP